MVTGPDHMTDESLCVPNKVAPFVYVWFIQLVFMVPFKLCEQWAELKGDQSGIVIQCHSFYEEIISFQN